MLISPWEISILVSKWLTYVCVACAIGGVSNFLLMRQHTTLVSGLYRYSLFAMVVGLISVCLNFLVQVGSWAENGFLGMVDPFMFPMLWESSVGDSLLSRLLGLGVMLFALLSRRLPLMVGVIFFTASILLIGLSFSQTGHSIELGAVARGLLATHVVLMAWWMGSLYPVWLVCHRLSFEQAHQELQRFGEIAAIVVSLLLVCGLVLSYQLTGWNQLFSSEYGFWLLLKVGMVVLILMLAAFHKWKLVPALAETGNKLHLRRSILIEKIIGIAILVITTILTTLVGPAH